ncbi:MULTISPECIES: MFS transporter [Brevibacterium]|uniref:MFS transporter n=1 Tax=Brevibacterium TaxID=1696 RepID=UPI001BAC8E18|nr:MFS transporter [Brevibacterium sp. W7.2]
MNSTEAARSSGRAQASTASGFFSGPAELLAFVLPVVAAQHLGASGAETGALVAVQLLVSLLIRPLAGRLVDRCGSPRSSAMIAAAGSGVGVLSFLVFAASTTLPPAFAAAALGGIAGALFWVAVRALIAERAEGDIGDDRFAVLMENESSGAWIAFIIGIPLFQVAGPQAVFLACAVACLVAGVLLARIGTHSPAQGEARQRPTPDSAHLLRSLRGILALVVVLAFAEGIISLLLILHLAVELGLELGEIALVYLPGAIVLSIAPRPLHRLVRRIEPRWILLLGLTCSAGFAAAMVTRPGPVALAVLWVLSALCFSLLEPLLDRLIAVVSGHRAGAGFGYAQSAELIGTAAGTLAAGALFGAGAWHVATIAAAVVLIIAALTGWRGLRRFPAADLGADERIRDQRPRDSRQHGTRRNDTRRSGTTTERKGLSPAMKRTAATLAIHVGIYVIAQVIFALVAASWPWEVITGGTSVTTLLSWNAGGTDMQRWIGSISRIWTIVVLIDILWSGYRMIVPKAPQSSTD